MRCAAAIRLVEIGKVIHQRAVNERAVLEAQVLGEVVGVRVIHAKLEGVRAVAPRDGVGELRAPLVREGHALQKCRNAEVEPVGDVDVGS